METLYWKSGGNFIRLFILHSWSGAQSSSLTSMCSNMYGINAGVQEKIKAGWLKYHIAS